jgi:excisionase family DNA binding protein
MSDAASTTTAYNVVQVMSRLGICRDAVYRAINSGALPARKFGKRTLILESDLQAFIESLPRLGDGKAA